jgi:hypothetical protein
MAVTYSPRVGYSGVTGSVAYGPHGFAFNIGAALTAGGGSFVVNDAELAQVLDRYPPLYRSSDDGQPLIASPPQRWQAVGVGAGLGSGEVAFEVRRTAEQFARWQVLGDGSQKVGDGTVAPTAAPSLASIAATHASLSGVPAQITALQDDVTAVEADIAIVKEAALNVQHPEYASLAVGANWYPAVTAALAALPADGGEIIFPADVDYRMDTTPKVLKNNVTFRGVGRLASTIYSATVDVLSVGDASTDCNSFTAENLTLQSNSGGGHCLVTAKHSKWGEMQRVSLVQHNAAKNAWRHPGAGSLIGWLMQHCDVQHVLTATVPSIYWLTNLVNFGCNENVIENCEFLNTGEYAIHSECAYTGAYHWGNVYRNLTMEDTRGGNVKLLSERDSIIEKVNTYDLGAATSRHLVFIGKSATNALRSYGIEVKKCIRAGGTLGGGLADVYLDLAYETTIDASGASSGGKLDLGGNGYVNLRNTPSGTTIANRAEPSSELGAEFLKLPGYTVATRPAAASVPDGTIIYVSDGAAGARFQGVHAGAYVNLG